MLCREFSKLFLIKLNNLKILRVIRMEINLKKMKTATIIIKKVKMNPIKSKSKMTILILCHFHSTLQSSKPKRMLENS